MGQRTGVSDRRVPLWEDRPGEEEDRIGTRDLLRFETSNAPLALNSDARRQEAVAGVALCAVAPLAGVVRPKEEIPNPKLQ